MKDQGFTKESLLAIANQHKNEIKSLVHWNEYRKDKELPHGRTFMLHFGSWNNFKKALSLSLNEQSRPLKYTDEKLYAILEENKAFYTSAGDWNVYAEENGLPKHLLFMERLGPEKIHEKTGLIIGWTKKIIGMLILEHFPSEAPTTRVWLKLGEDIRLPHPRTVVTYFGSWDIMKQELYGNKSSTDKN